MDDISIFIGDIKFNFRVGLLIICDDKFLLEFEPNSSNSCLPGGRVKTGETTIKALKREIQEEMHYNLKDDDVFLKGIVENFFTIEDKKFHELFYVYKMKINKNHELFRDDLINYDSDNSYYKWIKYSDIDNINFVPNNVKKWLLTDNLEVMTIK